MVFFTYSIAVTQPCPWLYTIEEQVLDSISPIFQILIYNLLDEILNCFVSIIRGTSNV